MTYTEGWPKTMMFGANSRPASKEVVPLSDAERLREALERIASGKYMDINATEIARDALDKGPGDLTFTAPPIREGWEPTDKGERDG